MAEAMLVMEDKKEVSASPGGALATKPGWETPAWRRLRRRQALLSLLFLTLILLTCGAVSLLARNAALHRFLLRRELRSWKQTNGIYAYHPGFTHNADWLFLDRMSHRQFPRGGVIFTGSSTMQHAVMPWTLPADERPFVEDYAIDSANFAEQNQWIHFLADKHGIFRTGPKMLVVLGLCYFDMRMKLPGEVDCDYIPNLFKRYPWYRYDKATGIHDVRMNPWKKWWAKERLRDYDFLECFIRDLRLPTGPFRVNPPRTAAQNNVARAASAAQLGHRRWRSAMRYQTRQLANMIDCIQRHGAKARVVLLPLASWNDGLPYPAAFAKRVRAMCAKRSVPVLDLSHRIPDDQFADDGHLNYTGTQVISPILLGLAQRHLARYGLARPKK